MKNQFKETIYKIGKTHLRKKEKLKYSFSGTAIHKALNLYAF